MLLGVLTLSPLHKQVLNFACCLAPDVPGTGAGQGSRDGVYHSTGTVLRASPS